jgi:hypothetical protein
MVSLQTRQAGPRAHKDGVQCLVLISNVQEGGSSEGSDLLDRSSSPVLSQLSSYKQRENIMRRHVIAFVAAVTTLLLLSVTPVRAISNGVIDTDHPQVGAMGVQFEPGAAFFICSGTLIAPDVFLVAAHCVAGLSPFVPPEHVVVTFDVNLFTASTLIPAIDYAFDPAFGRDAGDLHDLGVIILSRNVTEWNGTPVVPATLPTAGLLDQMAARGGLRGTSFVNVGYGADPSFKGAPPSIEFDGYRKTSTSTFQGLTLTWLKLLMNSDATGEGGTCYLDSGGPKLVPGTNMIVAVQSAGDRICRAESFAYRLDTPQARGFLGQFVTLP